MKKRLVDTNTVEELNQWASEYVEYLYTRNAKIDSFSSQAISIWTVIITVLLLTNAMNLGPIQLSLMAFNVLCLIGSLAFYINVVATNTTQLVKDIQFAKTLNRVEDTAAKTYCAMYNEYTELLDKYVTNKKKVDADNRVVLLAVYNLIMAVSFIIFNAFTK